MLQTLSYFPMFFLNLILVGAWHMTFLTLCQKRPDHSYRPTARLYRPHAWEREGRWYRDHLNINAWKDRLPQFIAKDGGFSKGHLRSLSPAYLDRFVREPCRGEWMHLSGALCAVLLLVVNPIGFGLVTAFLTLLGNLPFAAIQRYNRFRLQTLRKRLLRTRKNASSREAGSVLCGDLT